MADAKGGSWWPLVLLLLLAWWLFFRKRKIRVSIPAVIPFSRLPGGGAPIINGQTMAGWSQGDWTIASLNALGPDSIAYANQFDWVGQPGAPLYDSFAAIQARTNDLDTQAADLQSAASQLATLLQAHFIDHRM